MWVPFLFSTRIQLKTTLPSSTGKDELLETAMALHEAAMKDDYFISRKLAPNVDFWLVTPIHPMAFAWR